jgi:D-glycero-D-manno-heptose 1,7-bisphosphate phosphatase
VSLNAALFLDRDGVINKSRVENGTPYPPIQTSEVQIIEGVNEALTLIRNTGLDIVVVTNQPDVARGTTSKHQVNEINNYLSKELKIDHFYTCFHDDSDECECRKPKSGLLIQAAQDLELNLESSFLVGDRWRDIEAGQSAGCACYFIDYSYSEKQPSKPYYSVTSLFEAVQHILRS